MKTVIVVGILLVVFCIIVFGLWFLINSSVNVSDQLEGIKIEAEKAMTKNELERVYQKYLKIHKKCWHKVHYYHSENVYTYIKTKYEYI